MHGGRRPARPRGRRRRARAATASAREHAAMLRHMPLLILGASTTEATYGCNNGQRAPDGSAELAAQMKARPKFHFWPDTIESQDISAPIKINDTWHVFMDCVPEGCPALVQPVRDKPLSWCHFSSPDLVHWVGHPIAIAPDHTFDGSIIDTGSIFQHPNGTVIALYATSNITSNLPGATFDGDLCLAVSDDPGLLVWKKICHRPSARIVNPTCHWCRETCPQTCKQNINSSEPSPFPGIASAMAHRDPVAPWLDSCGGSSKEQCWYAMSGSGGKIPGQEELGPQSAMLLWKTDFNLSTSWTFVKVFWTSKGASVYSCPDFFRLPGSEHTYVFGSLDGNYWVGTYGHDAKGLPHFDGPRAQNGATAGAPNGTLRGMGIWKTGGVGANNVMSRSSRRVMFGTIGWTNGDPLISLNPLTTSLHVGSVAALPRDVTAAAVDGNMALTFVPELAVLRDNASHVHTANIGSNTTGALFHGRQIEIKATFAAPGTTNASGLVVLAPRDPPVPQKDNCSDPFVPCYGWDRSGADLGCTSPPGTVQQCEAKCLADAACMAWTWCGKGSDGPGPRCCLKSKIPPTVAPFAHMVCGIAPRAKGHIPAGAMDFSHPGAPAGGTEIYYDPLKHTLSISSHDNPGHDSTPLTLRDGEALSLHVYVDANLVEVVANNRASLATSVRLPPSASDDAVRVACGGACNSGVGVVEFDAWALHSIWD